MKMAYLKFLKTELRFNRILFYIFFGVIILGILDSGYMAYSKEKAHISQKTAETAAAQKMIELFGQYKELSTSLEQTKTKYLQINLQNEDELLKEIKKYIAQGDYTRAKKIYDQLISQFNEKIAEEQKKGILSGKVTFDSTNIVASLKILQGETLIVEIQSDSEGIFSYWLAPGTYSLKVNASGYDEFSKDIEIKTGETSDQQIVLTKPASKAPAVQANPAPSASTSSSESAASDGVYSKQSVSTERGSFTVHLLQIDLNQYEVKVDTAADGDCENDCPVKSLGSYVAQNGGFAGIHGTYFCPTSYSSCAGKTNSFYYKLYNTRLDKKINWTNGLGDYLPFLSIDRSGFAHYSDTWYAIKDSDMKTGISCRPHLVEGGEIVLTDGDMDSDKERTSKISHGFIGIKGQVFYAGVVLSANLPDVSHVIKALGIENAFNIDGGGTTAMYYNGSYKVGPGRDMPNAIIFVKK